MENLENIIPKKYKYIFEDEMIIANDIADYMDIDSIDEYQKLYLGNIYCKGGFIAQNAYLCYDGENKNIPNGRLEEINIITE